MKKVLSLLVAPALLLWGCHSQPDTNTNATTVQQDTLAAPVGKQEIPMDTIQLGTKTFYVYAIDQATFEKYPPIPLDSNENEALLKDTLVKRSGDKLIFKLENGKEQVLTNNQSEGDDYVNYTYLTNYPQIKQKGVLLNYYEGMGYTLVNTQNGDTVYTWSPAVISPDKKYLVTASMDLVAAFDPNGFQLYEISPNYQVKLIGEKYLEKWGPVDVQWIDNKTLICKHVTIDDNTMETRVKYVKLVMQ
ncbi:hypothetical protein [Chitinophaga nivalis]|uniref:Lipoprotein n=1 Tax=Chitinophaga nivalis TaxID=2991709 RepID=A0ABT3ISU1_9BACT|nr:hypothetical protein [Chitinophaga nivalis]MCW3463262.1 hypothetical protein [Chitinophaga nivalis]MCW3487048.1 hypothetical protein [Chitinophaga nivalis]